MPVWLNYTNEDILNVFIFYGQCNKVLRRTSDAFAAYYPYKQKPSPLTVKIIIDTCKNSGTIN